MRMVKRNSLMSWSSLKESRRLGEADYVDWTAEGAAAPPGKLVFVSHRWITADHPDPEGTQLRELQGRLNSLIEQDASFKDAFVFFDYCSMLQRPRTVDEDAVFHRDIESLRALSRAADKIIVLSEGYADYKNRAWCFFEAIVSEEKLFFFDDQTPIKDELYFRDSLIIDEGHLLTSYDFSYKTEANEAEIIVAAFQHLKACRLTHADDFPLIKKQMVAHFNSRRLSSFGRLMVAVNKFFDVVLCVAPVAGGDVECTPFFEQPEWPRLPSFDNRAPIMGGRGGPSLFAISHPNSQEVKVKRGPILFPALKLSLPGVADLRQFMDRFHHDHDWQRYIVSPAMLGMNRGDCFPTIDHVIHTILERPPGFQGLGNAQYLYLPLI